METMLAIPYRSQHDADAGQYRGDCGPACVAMLIQWRTGQKVNIDFLSSKTGLKNPDTKVTSLTELKNLLGSYGIGSEVKAMSVDFLKSMIDAGRSVIVLIHYPTIEDKQDLKYRGDHFVVVRGYSDSDFIVNDPDFWGNRRNEGDGNRIPIANFDQAMKDAGRPYIGLVVEGSYAVAEQSAIKMLIEELSKYPTDTTLVIGVDKSGDNLPPREFMVKAGDLLDLLNPWVEKIAEAGLRIRETPSITAKVLGSFTTNTRVWVRYVSDSAGYDWHKLRDRAGYVSGDYLTNPNRPSPQPTARKSWIGLHSCAGTVVPEFLPTIENAARQGTPVTGVTLVFNWWLAKAIKERSPKTLVGVRNWPDGSPPIHDPDTWFNNQYHAMKHIEGVDYFIMTNEWGDWNSPVGVDYLARFWRRMIERAIDAKIKITMLDLAVGWVEPWAFEKIRPVLQFGADHGMPLNYHPYAPLNDVYHPLSDWEHNTGRAWKWMEAIPNLLLWGGEAGPPEWKHTDGVDAHFRGSDDFRNICWETDEVILKASPSVQSRVLTMCYWATNTDPRWQTFEVAPALRDGTYLRYLKSRAT